MAAGDCARSTRSDTVGDVPSAIACGYTRVGLLSVGGMIPNADCRCEIDPLVKDRWGIPVLRFHWKAGEQEIEQARHAVASMSDMIQAMGGKPKATLHYAVTISVSVVEPTQVGPAVTDRVFTITQGADRTQPAATSPVPRP